MFLSLYTERRPIVLRSPSDRIASAARRVEQSFYNTKGLLFIDKKKCVGFYGVARLVQQRLLHPL